MTRVLRGLLDLVFPPRCLVCDEVVPRKEALCPRCRTTLPLWRNEPGRCPVCGKPAGSCVCRGEPFAFLRCHSAALYGPEVEGAILTLKRDGQSPAAAELAALMVNCLREQEPDLAFDGVTEVPMSAQKLAARGHNQAERLAAAVAERLGLPHLEPPLVQSAQAQAQHAQDAAGRFRNAEQSYAARPGAAVSGRLLLVDDVATTGATLHRCAALLLECGAAEVVCLTAATTPRHARTEAFIE